MGLDLGVGELSVWIKCGSVPNRLQTQPGETHVLKPVEWKGKNQVGKSPPKREWILLYKAFD